MEKIVDVIFDESTFLRAQSTENNASSKQHLSPSSAELDISGRPDISTISQSLVQDVNDEPMRPEDCNHLHYIPPSSPAETDYGPNIGRDPERTRTSPGRFDPSAMVAKISKTIDPSTAADALSSPQEAEWQLAMKNEIDSLRKTSTWKLKELPDGRKAIRCRWDFKIKLNAN